MSRLVDMIARLRNTGRPVDSIDPDDFRNFGPPPQGVSAGRRVAPAQPGNPNAVIFNAGSIQTRYVGSQDKADRWGHASFTDYLNAVKAASDPQPGADALKARERLLNAASTYGSEGVGADGGFAIPPTFREAIATKVEGDAELLPRCDVLEIGSSTLEVPKDEGAPWSTSGVRAFWTAEGEAMPQSKPALQSSTIKLAKLTALVPITDELLEDAPALGGYVIARSATAINDRLNAAIVAGTGVAQPLGILNSGALVTQAKETSQVSGTIHGLNLLRMWSRMPAAWRKTAVWLAHPDAEPLLMQAGLQISDETKSVTVGGALVYVAPNGISGEPYATLFGRPVIHSQHCKEPGQVGDIVLAALPQYMLAMRQGGLRSDASIHLFFDQGITAFRFTLRINGQPWWSSPIPDYRGSNTRGAFVALAAR